MTPPINSSFYPCNGPSFVVSLCPCLHLVLKPEKDNATTTIPASPTKRPVSSMTLLGTDHLFLPAPATHLFDFKFQSLPFQLSLSYTPPIHQSLSSAPQPSVLPALPNLSLWIAGWSLALPLCNLLQVKYTQQALLTHSCFIYLWKPELTVDFYQTHQLLPALSNLFSSSDSKTPLSLKVWPQLKLINQSHWLENGALDFQILRL